THDVQSFPTRRSSALGSVWGKNNEEEQENMEQLEELKTYVDDSISEINDRLTKLESVVLQSDNEEKDETKDETKDEEKDEVKDEVKDEEKDEVKDEIKNEDKDEVKDEEEDKRK